MCNNAFCLINPSLEIKKKVGVIIKLIKINFVFGNYILKIYFY